MKMGEVFKLLHFLDFEVTIFDWLVTIANPITQTELTIVNNPQELIDYYNKYKTEIFIGYNIREYDQWIFKGILAGFNPYEISQWIVDKHNKGYQFSSVLRRYPLIIYDLMQKDTSLKELEAYQGHNVYESDVDFKIKRKLTQDELAKMIRYNKNDVQELLYIFPLLKGDFDVQLELIKEYRLPLSCMSLTQTQLTAEILEAVKQDHHDDLNLTFQQYLNRIVKYKPIVDWYRRFKTDRALSDKEKNEIYSQCQNVVVAGCPHTFSWGGAHGALLKYSGTGYYLHIDVHQYYPSLADTNDYFPRGVSEVGKQRYRHMKLESIRLKAFPELKNKRAGYKLCNNKMTGGMKDQYSKLYDPLNNNNICVGGQLAILLLIEMLEPHIELLVQSNTDGLIIKLRSLDDYDTIDDVCWEWEKLTGVKLGFDPIITKIYQKDVNNYLFIDETGHVERKGAYVKELSPLDNDLPIINSALVEYMVNHVPVERTINSCTELVKFQKIVKLSRKYDEVQWLGQSYTNKCYRVFATTLTQCGSICKVKTSKARAEKFANTPEHAYLDNGDIQGKRIPEHLDRRWYIDVAKDRLRQFGEDVT